MSIVLSMIADPATAPIDDDLLARLTAPLPEAPIKKLASGIAYEASLDRLSDEQLAAARAACADAPVDINAIPAAHRRKTLLIADMDSTIIQQECIDEIAEYAGKRDEIADITERAMRGELDFDGALKTRVALLKGLSVDALEDAYRDRIALTQGARALVQTMKAHGARAALVSGGFTFFTERVGAAAGFDETQANVLCTDGDRLTGEVEPPILGRAAKEQALMRMIEAHQIDLVKTLAVGDGANDLAMLGRAGLGVAFHAKPAVAAAADARIDHGDLTALLYLQGYAQTEFVS